jgi:hypothetical protein
MGKHFVQLEVNCLFAYEPYRVIQRTVIMFHAYRFYGHKIRNVESSIFIILPVVLYGCETWPLTVREEHKLRVFENRVSRRIFGSKRDGVTGGWRKLYNEELHNLYSSSSIIRIIKSRRMRWAGHVARRGRR